MMKFLRRVGRFLEACKQIEPGPLGSILESIWLCWIVSEEELVAALQRGQDEIARAFRNAQRGMENVRLAGVHMSAQWSDAGQRIRLMADKVGETWREQGKKMRDL